MATNRRQQIQLSPDEQAAFFRERKKAALATIDRDGFPHVVAMNYVARDGAFYMTSYGKAQKVVNIRRNPRVALMIEAAAVHGLALPARNGAVRIRTRPANSRTAIVTAIAHAHALFVLTLEGERVSAITWFGDSSLFATSGSPNAARRKALLGRARSSCSSNRAPKRRAAA